MDDRLAALDWGLLRSFLAVARKGSLSGAARALGLSQPTLGRQVKALEAQLGVALFTRAARGLVMTETGQSLAARAEEMAAAAAALSLEAAGQATSLAGSVRLTAAVAVSQHVLPPIIADLRRRHPDIQLDILASDTSENLLFREADIAIRMYRPTQLDVVTLHLGDAPLGLFGSEDYLAGLPGPPDLETAVILGHDRDDRLIRGFRDHGMAAERSWFPVRTDDTATHWNLARAGCGLAFILAGIGRAEPGMVEVPIPVNIPPLPFWLTAHEAMRRTPRIAAVWDILKTGLGTWLKNAAP